MARDDKLILSRRVDKASGHGVPVVVDGDERALISELNWPRRGQFRAGWKGLIYHSSQHIRKLNDENFDGFVQGAADRVGGG